MSYNTPHRRYNLLTGEWVLVSPHRTKRPWTGAQHKVEKKPIKQHDSDCYLCPNVTRASGQKNPDYKGPYVFTNDFQAITSDSTTQAKINEDDILIQQPVKGTCRVICYSPRHDLTMSDMSIESIIDIIKTWQEQYIELSQQYVWVQIFENKGQMMGCSNPHPHGQIWASDFIPQKVSCENNQQEKYFKEKGRILLLDYVKKELQEGTRIVAENDDWLVVVPFWAIWPYETLLLPKTHLTDIAVIDENKTVSLANILKLLLQKYDSLFDCSMPYSMGWHFAPNIEGASDFWQLHAHFYPPLLRSSTVKKFMVGYELLAEAQRDITPEQAAEILRGL